MRSRSLVGWLVALLCNNNGTVWSFQAPGLATFPRRPPSKVSLSASSSEAPNRNAVKTQLLELLSQAPPNQATPKTLTDSILEQVRRLEELCPTPSDQVLGKLAGTWELVWTTQDKASQEAQQGFSSWIGPLENQSYANQRTTTTRRTTSSRSSDGGRSNPVLPQNVQNRLEAWGVLRKNKNNNNNQQQSQPPSSSSTPVSTQSIDVKKNVATNIVSFRLFGRWRISLSVSIALQPDGTDPRRVHVEFQTCRVAIPNWRWQFRIPLFLIGLRGRVGWLRTTFLDDSFRITRGHKGSVFLLQRPSATTTTRPRPDLSPQQ